MKDELVGTLTALVISALKSLMMDQVAKLRQTGITGEAIYEGQAEDVLEPIKSGDYSIIYASPKSVLGTDYYMFNINIIIMAKWWRRKEEVMISVTQRW